jgi:hypothetical protein
VPARLRVRAWRRQGQEESQQEKTPGVSSAAARRSHTVFPRVRVRPQAAVSAWTAWGPIPARTQPSAHPRQARTVLRKRARDAVGGVVGHSALTRHSVLGALLGLLYCHRQPAHVISISASATTCRSLDGTPAINAGRGTCAPPAWPCCKRTGSNARAHAPVERCLVADQDASAARLPGNLQNRRAFVSGYSIASTLRRHRVRAAAACHFEDCYNSNKTDVPTSGPLASLSRKVPCLIASFPHRHFAANSLRRPLEWNLVFSVPLFSFQAGTK